MKRIESGQRVRIRDVGNEWHKAIAVSGVEGTHDYSATSGKRKIHDFPVVWVEATGRDGKQHRLPWPASDVVAE